MSTCGTCRWYRPGDPERKRLADRRAQCALTGVPVTSAMTDCLLWKSEHDPSPDVYKIVEELKAAKNV